MAELCRISSQFSRQLRNIRGAVKRIALQPVVRARVWTSTARRGVHTDRNTCYDNTGENNNTDDDNDTDIDFLRNIVDRAVLYKGIKNVFDLWQEYEFGLSGNKPAKDFTRLERGKHKFAYCRRKVFWEVIIKLVNAGHISDTAIDLVYQCYGRRLGVTAILRKMVADRKTGSHPNLQI